MEHWDLLCPGGYRILYDDALFPPGTDSFLLSSLPRLKPGLRVCDLGSGSGLLGLLLLQRQPGLTVTGVELSLESSRLAERAAAENRLTDHLKTLHGDLREIRSLLPTGSFDLVVSNPPYFSPHTGKLAERAAIRSARAELTCSLEELCAAASYLLRWGGSFCLVHRPERLTDLLCSLRSHAMEPKRLRLVCKRPESPPSLVLLDARRGGKPGLSIEPPLLLQTDTGSPTPELDAIYFRQQEDRP